MYCQHNTNASLDIQFYVSFNQDSSSKYAPMELYFRISVRFSHRSLQCEPIRSAAFIDRFNRWCVSLWRLIQFIETVLWRVFVCVCAGALWFVCVYTFFVTNPDTTRSVCLPYCTTISALMGIVLRTTLPHRTQRTWYRLRFTAIDVKLMLKFIYYDFIWWGFIWRDLG